MAWASKEGELCFKNMPGYPQLQGLYGFGIAHSRRHHEDFPLEAELAGAGNEFHAPFPTQVMVQQHQVNRLLAQDFERFAHPRALGGHLQVGLALQQTAQALAKKRVIIDQKNTGFSHDFHDLGPRSHYRPAQGPTRNSSRPA